MRPLPPRPPTGAVPVLLAAFVGAWLGGCGAGSDARPTRRVLVIGWDGASFRHVDPMLAAGALPVLEGLMRRGVQARMESTVIPISSAAWTSAVTGMGPGRTGVYSFFRSRERSYDIELASALSNRAAPIWRILSRRGIGCHVFGVPLTYPPEPVLGTMVAGMLSPSNAIYTHPPELTSMLRKQGFEPAMDSWHEERKLTISDFYDQLGVKERALKKLLERDDWNFAMVVFKSLDNLSHRAYGTRGFERVRLLYRELDGTLGRLIEAAGADLDVIVMSDHGFHSYSRGFNLFQGLLEAGFASSGSDPAEMTPEVGARAQVVHAEHTNRLAALDMTRSRAFPAHARGNYGTLFVNLAGRQPQGIVAPEDLDATLTEIEDWLRALETEDGEPLVTNVWRGKEFYPGPEASVVPDLLIEVQSDTQVVLTREGPVQGQHPFLIPDHERAGIFVAAGPDFQAREQRGTVSILDLAPTVLHLLGLPVYAEMDGRVLSEVLRPMGAPQIIAEADDPHHGEEPAGWRRAFSDTERAEVRRRLDKLGYAENR